MGQVQKLVTADSFDARGVFVPKGHIGTFDEALLNGDEAHIHEVGDFQPAMVEMAAIAPTGPNPKTPQQIPSDAQQDSAGTYALPGKTLVAEVTDKVEDRIEVPGLRDPENEAKVTETLGEIMGGAGSTTGNADDALVAGTVANVTADLGTKTDEQLNAMLAAENDREKPRIGVTNAIQEELDARTAQ
jgi:hypothetical protein